jgi:hypothetical protein
MDKKNKLNPTKTLLESNLFFVDDELTGASDEDNLADFSGMNNSSVSGGYAPSAMSNRDPGYPPIPTAEMAASQLDSIQQQSESGTSFSQAPSFGPGSANNSSRNAGSAILESMKKRNLGAQSGDNNSVVPMPPPAGIPSQINQPPANVLSQFNQSGGVGTSSSSDIARLPQPGLSPSGLDPAAMNPAASLPGANTYGMGVQSGSYDQSSGGYKSPYLEPQGSVTGTQTGSSGQSRAAYDERMPTPELVGEPAMNNSSTFPARSMPQSDDDLSEPHVGIATSSRIAKIHGTPESAGRGRRDDMESTSTVARSRIRSGVSSERPGIGLFIEQNKMAVIIVGVILLILIVAGAVVGVLYSMHLIKA